MEWSASFKYVPKMAYFSLAIAKYIWLARGVVKFTCRHKLETVPTYPNHSIQLNLSIQTTLSKLVTFPLFPLYLG